MAKQGKVLPARRSRERSADDDSILLRSAETIGRVIGSLQRQLDGARSRLSGFANDVPSNNGHGGLRSGGTATTRKRSAAVQAKPAGKSKTKRAAPARARKTTKGTRKPR